MAQTVNITTYEGIDEVLQHFSGEPIFDEVNEFFARFYADGDGDIDSSLALDDPEFTISVDDSLESCDYYAENRYRINLPSRDDADELAGILDGKVLED